jgi:UDP-sugar pyrophosphorylase
MQRASDRSHRPIPLVVMTSPDTHAQTATLLATHHHFGMAPEHVHLLMQQSVPAIADAAGRFAAASDDACAVQTKPHGHGDVHTLLHASGLLASFAAEQRSHLIIFQDTNMLAFRAIPAALGAALRRGLAMNSLATPRAPGEAAGAIVKLVRPTEPPIVLNIECVLPHTMT